MLKKKLVYTDFDGNEVEEELLFNLSKVETVKLNARYKPDMEKYVLKLIEDENVEGMLDLYEDILTSSYGVRSEDGKRFLKKDENGNQLGLLFAQTPAYDELLIEIATDANKAKSFMESVIPKSKVIPNKVDEVHVA